MRYTTEDLRADVAMRLVRMKKNIDTIRTAFNDYEIDHNQLMATAEALANADKETGG